MSCWIKDLIFLLIQYILANNCELEDGYEHYTSYILKIH